MAYEGTSIVDLLAKHEELTVEVQSLYQEHAMMKSAELEARRRVWESSRETTISGRERDTEYSTVDFQKELLKLDGEIKATLAEIKHIELRLSVEKGMNQ